MSRVIKKKPTKAKLERDCLDLWSLCVRTRDRTCRICNAEDHLQGHHIRSRQHASTVLDLENGMALCYRCHCLQRFNPQKFYDMILDCIGFKEYERLRVKSQVVHKWDISTLILEKKILQDKLRRLEEE
jgi:hypothetical protein